MKYLFFTLTCFFLPLHFSAQAVDSSAGAALLEKVPQEKIFVHYNSSLLFPGEYLYYKLYTLEKDTEEFSEISKVAYVELISEDGNSIFKHKLLLKNGQAQGDFFIPTTVPSGNYKLLSYSNWMRNYKSYFAGDIAIINPYRGDSSAILSTSEGNLPIFQNFESTETPVTDSKNPVKIILKNAIFDRREKVALKLEGVAGEYSLSVRKRDSISIPKKFTAEDFDLSFPAARQNTDSVFLPEARGNLISGRIVANTPDAARNLAGKKLAFSLPGKDYILKIATTNKQGKFYLNLDEAYDTPEALMQILGGEAENYEIRLDPLPQINAPELEFANFRITPAMKENILDRSVQVQIENAYYSVKPDTLKILAEKEPFYSQEPTVYNLDDYTRFPTIKETMVEIVMFAHLAKGKDGSEFVINQTDGATNFYLPALLIVDGAMVQDHDLLINYPAKYVKSIKILRDNFFLGSHIFSGIVDVETIEGNFSESLNQDYIKRVAMKLPEAGKNYFKQSYAASSGNPLSRIPDLRTQLLWKPSVEIDASEEVIEFFTSDVPGNYEIHLEGFTNSGEPVSVKKVFSVQARE
ncbi:hypothetical protein JRG66_09985 [Salinimicrobium tongyeongense]|uniref:MG2 domain-containing protein n=1 Tax=Salinimicrobium tongyeongense TaxID=2809707 RepID=A0ABY6NP29_9FLAO|nr:hypothetical protein [Salinimicrobium tongyeongense]UZH54318.1 hypothetical protein JRG66_09985 [Salinimicrobium tongyeongense]